MIFLGLFAGSKVILITCAVSAVVYLIVLALVQSALQAIFQTALYLYARDGHVPEGFHAEVLENALRR